MTFGFHQVWVEKIMFLINSISYKYQVNGFLSECLLPHRGLRQGDPLSPYLFIIVFDVLSRMLSQGRNSNVLQGVNLAANVPLTHLFFADDVLLFAQSLSGGTLCYHGHTKQVF